MDYQSQAFCERFYELFIPISSLVSFLYGMYVQSFKWTLITFAASTVLCLLVVGPRWPLLYTTNKQRWLSTIDEAELSDDDDGGGDGGDENSSDAAAASSSSRTAADGSAKSKFL